MKPINIEDLFKQGVKEIVYEFNNNLYTITPASVIVKNTLGVCKIITLEEMKVLLKPETKSIEVEMLESDPFHIQVIDGNATRKLMNKEGIPFFDSTAMNLSERSIRELVSDDSYRIGSITSLQYPSNADDDKCTVRLMFSVDIKEIEPPENGTLMLYHVFCKDKGAVIPVILMLSKPKGLKLMLNGREKL